MCAEVTVQTHFLTDGRDELPGLATLDRFSIGVGFGVKKYIILRIVIDTGIGFQVLCEGLPYTIINHNLMAFAPFLFLYPKPGFQFELVIQEMTDAELKQIGNAKGSIDPDHEQQQIAVTALSTQLIFDLSNLFSIADWFNKIHKIR
jgi:hypothetical protein